MKQNCDGVVTRQFRHWLNFHPGANVNHLKLPTKKLGLNIQLPSDIYSACQTVTRRIMATSRDPDIRNIFHLTKASNVTSDEIIKKANESNKADKKKECRKILKDQIINTSWSHFLTLKKESIHSSQKT